MIQCGKKHDISIIQGDWVTKRYRVEDSAKEAIGTDVIQRIVFSSAALRLEQELSYSENDKSWTLDLSSEITSALPPRSADYDITLFFKGDCIKTKVYRANITVLPKLNPITGGG